MVQFYFLSILVNVLVGLILIYGRNFTADSSKDANYEDDMGFFSDDESGEEKAAGTNNTSDNILDNKVLRLTIGVAGFLGGMVVLCEYFTSEAISNISFIDNLNTTFSGIRKIIGIFCLVVSFLHFIFPGALFL